MLPSDHSGAAAGDSRNLGLGPLFSAARICECKLAGQRAGGGVGRGRLPSAVEEERVEAEARARTHDALDITVLLSGFSQARDGRHRSPTGRPAGRTYVVGGRGRSGREAKEGGGRGEFESC